jgi:hypothetical protein
LKLEIVAVRGENMIIIFDKNTKEFLRFHGTNSKFPDGEIAEETLNLRFNEDYVKIPDDSDFLKMLQLL